MKRFLQIKVLLVLVLLTPAVFGQLSVHSLVPSTVYTTGGLNTSARILIPAPDLGSIQRNDEQNTTPYRFAVLQPVDIAPGRCGELAEVPGGRIWRVEVSAPGALGLSAYFDHISFREGEMMFLYPPDKSHILGAYTSLNNNPAGQFATSLIYGDRFILEFFQPSAITSLPELHLNEVAWAYRGVSNTGDERNAEGAAGKCEVNVACPEGNAWQEQKNGVVRIQIKKGGQLYWCSGSMLNNTSQDKKPYLLTADHCGFSATSNDLLQWIFYFGYEAPSCVYTGVIYPTKSIIGATLKAHGGNSGDTGSDFYLVLLNQSIPDSFNVFLNGWNRKDTASASGTGIHHPEGDVKKISTYSIPLVSTNYIGGPVVSHWKVVWDGTTSGHGVTEGGSSGSPIFDNEGRIVGTLTGGYSACDSASLNSPDYYGKLSYSWNSNGSDSASRLDYWLAPGNPQAMYLHGMLLSVSYKAPLDQLTVFPNPFSDRLELSYPGNHSGIEVSIYDMVGSLCYRKNLQPAGNTTFTISPAGLAPGVYILKAASDQGTFSRKIIKQ